MQPVKMAHSYWCTYTGERNTYQKYEVHGAAFDLESPTAYLDVQNAAACVEPVTPALTCTALLVSR
jgi:hypothetical protein